jgi:hypothetical protein
VQFYVPTVTILSLLSLTPSNLPHLSTSLACEVRENVFERVLLTVVLLL